MQALLSSDRTVEGLRLETVPDPRPAPSEVLVQVTHSSINRGDLIQVAGRTGRSGLGWDVSGTVLQTAADGSGPPAGQRVVGLVGGGAWAQKVAVHTGRLAVLPESVDPAMAATLPLAGLTALRALERGGSVTGRRILVTGAAGGVGSLAVQIAAGAGGDVTALVRTSDHMAPPPSGRTRTITSIEDSTDAYHVIVDAIGGPTLTAALEWLAPGGHATSFGAAHPDEPVRLPADFFFTAGHLHGFMIFDEPDYDRLGLDLTRLLALTTTGLLEPRIAATDDWTRTGVLLSALRDGHLHGKAVIAIT